MPGTIESSPRAMSPWRRMHRIALLSSAVLMCVMAGASPAQPPDRIRGEMLYENHCRFCHTQKIHERPGKPPLTRTQLRSIVNEWQRQEGLSWAAQDTEDVVEYLALTRYQRPRK